ncbi:MAG: hypothetical protein ACQEQA_04905 [Bacillota bacterium]
MKNMFKWTKRTIFILPLSLILLFLFLPIGIRLTMLGFKDGAFYTFEENDTLYTIDVSEKRMERIHLNMEFSDQPLTIAYPTDKSVVEIDSETHTCEYALVGSEFTCSEGTYTESEMATLKETIIYHYFIINESFNFRLIPKSQR